ncbi:hypothetical protein A3B21_03370 [Candidatus Uhrbacteria bacterium RIFCSPLOWO2_01_FULL_47_24]|uniref:Uncharacterized protein n=1 Tax=Candidatus Uhrbacteria bacterium RIFCSPLOWO2_01_FULL_47_24 TaxID=1802401 RepID=A0A1F7UT39_9BACT|nr:MAG: hypothetical protein A2753_05260 [Candidatus Uhrbacteria bacterium RIFCSPHIGHO2_01_FULL_47_11]OGL69055.1 MAG: hypothetical protein A3D58_04040 [Candidatus Uhrbacteria bacterium RIFCSPHIGHO2_02_FULL_46_47]OGL74627.1 MAG: hypothetical protein A3F52_01325 [Candidatus Uhrbacteria bacterium RIFCSPHIGHO2_12_FULL_47_11]OGL81425.1 MAG: hypothetical protein A3B21_03370 [Candidatus Uhrbacteria bacterium RIFCSPLOWO2_01_FULL_47_24]OGL83693.1 MAG: hypothetical protein A3J03_01540 [Candidatus Uhrbact
MNDKEDPQRLISLEESIKQSKEKLDKLEAFDVKIYVQEKIKEVEQKIDSSKINVIEALGIFVALFTFIAVNVQVFSKINDLGSAMWFMLVMGGITLTILLSVEILISGRQQHSTSGKLTWFQSLIEVTISKFGFLILLAALEVVAGFYFTYKNQVQLNNSASTSTKVEIQADIQSKSDSDVIIDAKDLNKLLPKGL